jgi:putative sugar O-methyltransferase
MKSSITDGSQYVELVTHALHDNFTFKYFKRHPKYKEVLEHVSYEQGLEYINIAVEQDPELLNYVNKFSENDKIGTPMVSKYSIGKFSPTTLRYIKVLSDLRLLFGPLDDMNIIEIGCGYGGQAKIIMDVHKVKSYTFIDLPPVTKLIRKYMNNFKIETDMNFLSSEDFTEHLLGEYDLVISNYAFSECSKEAQDTYISSVLNKSNRGYMVYNFTSHIYGVDSYSKEEILNSIKNEILLTEEKPLTHPDNCVIFWGQHDKTKSKNIG